MSLACRRCGRWPLCSWLWLCGWGVGLAVLVSRFPVLVSPPLTLFLSAVPLASILHFAALSTIRAARSTPSLLASGSFGSSRAGLQSLIQTLEGRVSELLKATGEAGRDDRHILSPSIHPSPILGRPIPSYPIPSALDSAHSAASACRSHPSSRPLDNPPAPLISLPLPAGSNTHRMLNDMTDASLTLWI